MEFYNMGPYSYFSGHIRSDFFDIEPIIDTMFSKLSAASVNGISSETSLEKAMKLYKLNNAVLPENGWENSIALMNVQLDEEINGTFTCSFNENVSNAITHNVSYGWYYYTETVGYKPNQTAMATSVTFTINLTGRKEGKGDKLAKGIIPVGFSTKWV